MCKMSEQASHQRRYMESQGAHKKSSTSVVTREIHLKIMRGHDTRKAIINWSDCDSHTLLQNGTTTLKNILAVSYDVKHPPIICPSILHIYPKERKIPFIQKNLYTNAYGNRYL